MAKCSTGSRLGSCAAVADIELMEFVLSHSLLQARVEMNKKQRVQHGVL